MLFVKKHPLPITFQLTFIIVMLILIILISSYLFLFQATSLFYIRNVTNELSNTIKEYLIKNPITQGQSGQLKRPFMNINAIVILNDELVTGTGQFLYIDNMDEIIERADELKLDKKSVIMRVGNQSFLVYSRAVDADDVTIIKPMREFDSFLILLRNAIFLILLVTIAISIFLSSVISHYISKPIKSIARDIKNISVSNLSRRIKVNESNQEFSILSHSVNDTLEKIENGYIRQKQFSSDVAHEIRTPLTSIIGFSKLIKRWGAKDPDVAQEAAEDIYNAGNNLIKLTEDLMFLSQPEIEIELKEINIKELVGEVLENFSKGDLERIKLQLPDKKIKTDRKLFKILLKTLVENALKYGDEKEVIIKAKDSSLEIIDRGKGISEADKRIIFNRFYQSDASRSTKGFGLGLSIAKKISESLDLQIEIFDNPLGGTCFTIQKLTIL